MRVNLQPAYIIHSRPYRDSSALLDVFTAEYGRIGVVARGMRRQSRRGSSAALLQPFIPLLLSFSGRTELKTLVAAESIASLKQECSPIILNPHPLRNTSRVIRRNGEH